ncbi:MAG: Uma2 family endonuclease [Cyanobacteria bacterium P01_E01_bin.42]
MVHLSSPLELEIEMSDAQFFALCQKHRDLQFERSATGELIVMPPTGGNTGKCNSNLNFQLQVWNRRSRLGEVFDSSTGFILPSGATRSPDVAWVSAERWNLLSSERRECFLPLCPDFVIELRSPSDDLSRIQAKMGEYQENGARLGWLIDLQQRTVVVYRHFPIPFLEIRESPQTISGEDVLPGFVLELAEIF